uniref:Uncharacterized protein n=1 Tax=Bionectria ochroleuca TaxID=29856 RepID=A0A0B7KNV1_BIOOC
MDILRLPGVELPKATAHENRLRYLVEQAGKCNENWKRNEHKVGGELHQCSTTKLHEQILAEFRTQYWLHNRKLAIARPHLRDTCWLKEGSISTSNGVFAVVIPLPFEEHCEVQYQAKKDDLTTREPLEWQNPILLPENSALILLSGSIKFILIDIEVTKSPDPDSKVGRQDHMEE